MSILSDDSLEFARKHITKFYDSDFSIQTQLFPEPFIGDPNSPLYVLGLNPGYSPTDDDQWYSDAEFTEAITNNINHRPSSFPFYFLNPKFELFSYHSHKYKTIPKPISSNSLVPSLNYSLFLVQQAILAKKTIVAMRALNQWFKLIPQLKIYHKLHQFNSPQNVSLSTNDIVGYSALVNELLVAKKQRTQA